MGRAVAGASSALCLLLLSAKCTSEALSLATMPYSGSGLQFSTVEELVGDNPLRETLVSAAMNTSSVTAVTNGTCFYTHNANATERVVNGSQPLFDRVVAFGDSLSDIGNVFRLTNGSRPQPEIYWHGRKSNGELWVEWLRQLIRATCIRNYAFIGASSDDRLLQGYAESGQGQKVPVPGARQQIEKYMLEDNATRVQIERTLVSVWTGSNDFLGPLIDRSLRNAWKMVESGVETIFDGIRVLLEGGGKETKRTRNLLVLNLPPIDKTPAANQFKKEIGPFAKWLVTRTFHILIVRQNNDLKEGLKNISSEFAKPNSTWRFRIAMFDAHGVTVDVLENKRYGFQNVEDSCVTYHDREGKKNATICAKPDEHFYYNDVHPSARAHHILGSLVADFVNHCFTTNLTKAIYKPENTSWTDSTCYGRLA